LVYLIGHPDNRRRRLQASDNKPVLRGYFVSDIILANAKIRQAVLRRITHPNRMMNAQIILVPLSHDTQGGVKVIRRTL